MTSMYNLQCNACYSCQRCRRYIYVLIISAIRTVSRGHQLVAEGWAAFEQTCKEVGAGELPQLLRYVRMATTPTPTTTPTPIPTPTPTKFETKEEEMDVEATATMSADPPKIGEFIEKPIHISVEGKTKMYKCGNSDITPTCSRMGMDSHIHAVHTKKALVCSFCAFSTYNMDSLQ